MISRTTASPAVVWASLAALLLGGAVSTTRLGVSTRTTVELPRLQVSAGWDDASAEMVEMYVTAPIEEAIQGVRGVVRTESDSRDGSAGITVHLAPTADVQLARLGILERLELLRTHFPPGATPPRVENYVPEALVEAPLLRVTIAGPYTPGSLQRLLEDRVRPRLATLPGVAAAQMESVVDLGVAVVYDPQHLRALGLTPADLARTIDEARFVRALGAERLGSVERVVVLDDQPRAASRLAELQVRGARGRVHRLGEVASIRPDEDSHGRFFRIDGLPAIALRLTRLPTSNAIKTAAVARAALDELRPSLPAGVRVHVVGDSSVDLKRQLVDLMRRGTVALGAVLVVLLLTLRDVRASLLVMGTGTVAVAGTALSLFLLQIPANSLTLAGLGMGIGVLVQNGLIVVNRLARAPNTPAGRAEVARRMVPAVLGATLTTAVMLLPFLYLQGDARAAFVPFAAAFALALAWSAVAALLMVPALGIGHELRVHRSSWPRARRVYGRAVSALLRWRWATVLVSALVLTAVAWAFVERVPRFKFGAPELEPRERVRASLAFPRGSDPGELDRTMSELETIALGRREVEQVIASSRGPLSAGLEVTFTREGTFTGAPAMIEEALVRRAVLIGGVEIGVQHIGPGFGTGSASASPTLGIRVLGYSYAGTEQLARDLAARLNRITRVRGVRVGSGGFLERDVASAITILPDRAALARHGLTARDLTQAVGREVRGGATSTRLFLDGEELPVALRASGARERSLDELRDALVPTPQGGAVRIADIATMEERETPGVVRREDQQYVRTVRYSFRGPAKLARRTHEAVLKATAVPPGYAVADLDHSFGVGPDGSERGLWHVFAVGVALVILAVAVVFDSVWAAAMVVLTIPLALGGVMGAFWLSGSAFTREAAVGIILVMGLAVNQAILFVDAALERRRANARHGRVLPLRPLQALRATHDHAGMIAIVTLTTLASLAPFAVGADPDSLFSAIALATAGGTVAGALSAMFVLPAIVAAGKPRR